MLPMFRRCGWEVLLIIPMCLSIGISCYILVKLYHSQIPYTGLVSNSFKSYLNGSDHWPWSILGAYNQQLSFILVKLQVVISHPSLNIHDTAFNPCLLRSFTVPERVGEWGENGEWQWCLPNRTPRQNAPRMSKKFNIRSAFYFRSSI